MLPKSDQCDRNRGKRKKRAGRGKMSDERGLERQKKGCGLLNVLFGTKKSWPRRSTSTGSLPKLSEESNRPVKKIPSAGHNSKRRRGSFDDLDAEELSQACPNNVCPISGPPKVPTQKQQPEQQQQQQHQNHNGRKQEQQYQNHNGRKQEQQYQNDNGRKEEQQQYQNHNGRKQASNETGVVPAASRSTMVAAPQNQSQGQHQGQGQNTRKTVPKESLGISGELEMMLSENLRNGGGPNFVRVSSGNVMVHSSLGNLRQSQQAVASSAYTKPASNGREEYLSRYPNSGMGNVVNNNKQQQQKKQNQGKTNSAGNPLCRALSCRMDPEDLKIMGNEDYKNGRFAEALALYERAIDLDPTKASYRSNKSAALVALGRLLEAVFECREAIEIEPQYHRAHHRLANLYVRLGEAEKALYHFKQAGPEADPDVMSKAKVVLGHLKKCDEAKRLKDLHTLLKESGNAITAGADSAPMVFALQAEAYLKLHQHDDADMTLANGPHFDADQCTKFFGPVANATLLVIRAQVDLAAGRFDEAMEAVQLAGRLDPNNREVGAVTRRARAVSTARSTGNDLFKESKFSEACLAYGQGLEHDPYNSILLCNRAACRIKLGQFEKAIEDCTSALNVRPSYSKARLRRAECNAKLQKWEATVRDYEILSQESPGDENVGRGFFEAQVQLKKQRGEDVSNMKFGNEGVVKIQNNAHFKNLTSWPGLSVAWFFHKPEDKLTLQFMEELCKRYPTLKFLKVEVEDNQSLVKSEGVSSLPAFKIYINGSRVKDISGEDHEAVENSIKEYTN